LRRAGALAAVLLGAGARAVEPAGDAARTMPLSEAVESALRGNRDLKILVAAVEAREVDVATAGSEFTFRIRPDATAEASGDRDVLGYGVSASRRTGLGSDFAVEGRLTRTDSDGAGLAERGSILVRIDQPLLRHLGPLVNRENVVRAESRAAAAQRELALRRSDLVVRVVEIYQELFRLQAQVDCDAQAVDRLDRFLRLSRARERQGRTTRVETLRSELKAGEARLRLHAARQRRRSLCREFADVLGLAPETEIRAEAAPLLKVTIPAPEEAMRVALRNRLDLAQILSDLDDAARGVRVARRHLLPDVRMISRYERFGEGPGSADAGRLDESVWFVGLTLSRGFPMRDEKADLTQAEIRERVETVRVDSVKSAIARQVQQELLNYEQRQTEAALAEENYGVGRRRLTLAQRLFESDRSDAASVSDGEDELRQAQNQWLEARAAACVAGYRVLRAMGTLVDCPSELKPRGMPP
jgi:outer membrane protein TolC